MSTRYQVDQSSPAAAAYACLEDVVSHHHALMAGLVSLREANCPSGRPDLGEDPGSDDRSYWQHEINVLNRMRDQAILATTSPQKDILQELALLKEHERSSRAAFSYAAGHMNADNAMDFLAAWQESSQADDFSAIRQGWPEAPADVYPAGHQQADQEAARPYRPKA